MSLIRPSILTRGGLAALSFGALALGCAHARSPAGVASTVSQAPSRPTGLVVTLHPSGEFVLAWRDNSVGETGFMVVADCDDGSRGVVGVVGADQTRVAVRGLEVGRTCSCAVFAINEAGISNPSNLAIVTHALRRADGEPEPSLLRS